MSDEPIRAREKCYPPVWLILKTTILCEHVQARELYIIYTDYKSCCNYSKGTERRGLILIESMTASTQTKCVIAFEY